VKAHSFKVQDYQSRYLEGLTDGGDLMKLVYKGKRKLVMLPERNLFITDNMEVATDDKEEIKKYKELGFTEIKTNKKKEGDY
jgi:hypothetical protein